MTGNLTIIYSLVLTVIVGCKTVDTISFPVTKKVYPRTMLVVSGVTSPVQVVGREDYASIATVEFRDAADKIVKSRYSYLPMSAAGEQFLIVTWVPTNAQSALIGKVDTRPDVQVRFSRFDAYCGMGGCAATEKSVSKVDSLSALVTDSLNQKPADALESVVEINDICPIRFEVDVVGSGMADYRRSAILCQVAFRDGDGNPLKATGMASNERYGDWFYIGVAPGENSFKKTIRPPEGARSMALKLSRFFNEFGLSVKKFNVVH